MATTINLADYIDSLKDFLEKIGCTNIEVKDLNMRTVYVIKEHSVAKETNKSFAGEEAFYYTGKGGKVLKASGSHIENDKWTYWPREYTYHDLEQYGYKRYCDACRVAKAMKKDAEEHNNSDDYYWRETITVIAETIPV